MNLQDYEYVEIGDVFPFANPIPNVDYVNPMLNEKSFDIAIFITNPSKEEIDLLTKNALFLYVVYCSKIPIIIADFGYGFQFAVPLNVYTFGSKKVIENWLECDCEPIRLLLIDGNSNILHALRLIPIETSEIKEELKLQYKKYKSAEEVEIEIESIFSKISRKKFIDSMKMNLIMQYNL